MSLAGHCTILKRKRSLPLAAERGIAPSGACLERYRDEMTGNSMPQRDIDQAIQEHVKAHAAAAVEFLAALVRIPSDNPPGDCVPHATATAERLEKLGFAVERHPVPPALCQAHGMIAVTNLVVRKRFGPGPTIALNAHGDVVPPGAGWSEDPYGARISDGVMHGRGVAVSKSDIATYAFALLAAEHSGAKLNGSVELHITYDEETGGEIGPLWLLEQGISRPTLAIAAGFSYSVLTAHNGCLHLEVEVTGRSAHAAKPWTGIDALEAANGIMSALYDYRRGLAERVSSLPQIGSPQLTIGLISGGINTNVVPDRVVFRLDRRIIPEEDAGAVETEVESRHRWSSASPSGRSRLCPAHPAGRTVAAVAGGRWADGGPMPAGFPGHGRAHHRKRRPALHRCPALCRERNSYRALWGRAAHHRGGQRASGR